MALSLGMFACGNSPQENETAENTLPKDRVEVLYFHGKQRCATCIAIEKQAKEAVETQFADELENGTVVFKSLDISQPEHEKIADKYEVSWSSLLVCQWKDGKESHENLTEYAFKNARTAQDTFKQELTGKITELLK